MKFLNIMILIFLAVSQLNFSQKKYTWNGGNGSWQNAANWTPAGIPGVADTAVINIGTVTLESTVTVAGVIQNGGTINGNSDMIITINYNLSSGSHEGDGVTIIPSGSMMQLTSGFGKTFGRNFIIDGTLEVIGNGGVSIQNARQLVNNGLLEIKSNLNFGGNAGGSIINNGTFIRSTATGSATLGAALNNNGILIIQTGTLNPLFGSNHTTSSPVTINTGARLLLNGGTNTLNDITFTGGGTLELSPGGTMNVTGNLVTIDSSINFIHNGGTIGGVADLLIVGDYNFSSGTHGGDGVTTIPSGSILQLISGFGKTFGRNIIIDGTLEVIGDGGVGIQNARQLVNNGVLEIKSNLNFGGNAGGSIINNGTFIRSTATGTATVGARYNNNGILELLSGTLSFNDSLKNNLTGTIKGIGTLAPPPSTLFVNNGTVSPGLSPGVLRFSGNYSQSLNAGLDIEIGGFTAGTERDSLAVTGSAALNGNLNVQFINNFLPEAGDEFFIMSHSSRTGQFSQVNLSNNVSGNLAYLSNGVRLTITHSGINQPPVAVDDSAVTNKNQPVSVNVLENDFDPDNDPISISSFTQPQNGSVVQSGDSILTYTPNFNFVGSDSLTYTIEDNNGAQATAMVRITVLPFNYPPTAPVLVQPVNNDTLLIYDPITFMWNSSIDPDGDPVTYSLRIFGSGVDTTISQLSDTTIQFNGSGILQPGIGYLWRVTASDGNLTTLSNVWSFYIQQVSTGLAGIYTIGDGGDFPTITAAADALTSFGVTGQVTFKILSGTYDEQVVIDSVAGVSSENNIVFESATGNREDVIWGYSQLQSGPENYLLRIDFAENITIRTLTFKAFNNNTTRLLLVNVAGNLVIENNEFILPKVNTSSISRLGIVIGGGGYDTLKIKGNSIKYGTNGVVIFSWSWGIPFIDISDNTFIDQTNNSISLSGLSVVKIIINNNYIDNRNTIIRSKGGILIGNSNNLDFEITGNKIFHLPSSSGSNTDEGRNSGIHVLLGSNINVINGLIANNFIKLYSSATNGTYTSGIHIAYKQNSGDIKILHNTIQWIGNNNYGSSNCIYLVNSINCTIKNNILVNEVNGSSLRVTDTTGNVSDYNNLFKIGPQPIVYWGGNSYTDLTSYQTATGQDLNSFNIMPSFISPEDVHLNDFVLNNAGTPVPEVTTDIDGEPRDPNNPDIGADEFEPQGFQGIYTIGSGGDFSTMTAAVNVLMDTIVTGPVTFNILSGDYDEQVVIGPVNGASEQNPITFQSQTGNRGDVVWGYSQQSSNSNYVIQFNKTSHINIRNLTIEARNQQFGRLITFQDSSNNIVFMNNYLIGIVGSTGDDNLKAVIYSHADQPKTNIKIKNNLIEFGSIAVQVSGSTFTMSDVNIELQGNICINQSSLAFSLSSIRNLVVNNNLIELHSNQVNAGITLTNIRDNLSVTENKIMISNISKITNGILLSSINNLNERGLIANNFIRIKGGNGQDSIIYGIRLVNVRETDLYHNAIRVNEITSVNSAAVSYAFNSNLNKLKNNILVNESPGYALINAATDLVSDYNNFKSNTTNLVSWNNNIYATLANYQNATGQDLNSLSLLPGFVSDTDLHLTSRSPLINKGTPLTEVTHDIDGQPRSLTTPDIGADEFTSTRGITKTRTDLKKPINGQSTTRDTLFINPSRESLLLSSYAVTDVNILLDKVSHINLADLVITLSFNGITDTLAVNLPDSAAGFIHTLLDDDAEVPLLLGVPPFTGAFKPYKPLSAFNGIDAEGDWILEIYDQSTGTNGILDAWGIEIEFEILTNIISEPEDVQLTDRYDLAQNYPNPFNPSTTISWQSPVGSHQTLKIYDILGKEVATLVNEYREAGRHSVTFDASRLASGVYIYRLSAGSPSTSSGQGFVETKKMILIR